MISRACMIYCQFNIPQLTPSLSLTTEHQICHFLLLQRTLAWVLLYKKLFLYFCRIQLTMNLSSLRWTDTYLAHQIVESMVTHLGPSNDCISIPAGVRSLLLYFAYRHFSKFLNYKSCILSIFFSIFKKLKYAWVTLLCFVYYFWYEDVSKNCQRWVFNLKLNI